MNGAHVVPNGDLVDHDLTDDCVCGPTVQWGNADTGEAYDDGPLVIHHSLDGRELHESPHSDEED